VVSGVAIRLYRLVLFAYPPQFRRGFGGEMERLLVDRRRHEACSEWRILLDETVDAVRAAPRMRWESPMNRIVILAVFGTMAIAAALVAQLALLPLAAAGLAAWFAWGRPLQPIASAAGPRRGVAWLIGGGVAIAVAIAIPAIDGGELNALWWTVMMLALLGGIGMVIAGASLGIGGRAHRASSPHNS
jgi:hypothetical protein